MARPLKNVLVLNIFVLSIMFETGRARISHKEMTIKIGVDIQIMFKIEGMFQIWVLKLSI